jgi:hypothetical protein
MKEKDLMMSCALCHQPLMLIPYVIDGEVQHTWQICQTCPKTPHRPLPYVWKGRVYPDYRN